MSVALVRTALETALAAMSPSLATAYENASYTPVNGTPYQRVWLLAADPDNPEMGNTLHTERGIFQIDLAYPLKTGPGAAEARAQLIRSTFYRGRSFSASGVTVTIEKTPSHGPSREEADRYVIPVRVRFFAHIVRS
jgi:hypothetical protein